ncbi:PLD1_2 [Lepeophtheirus salmonis]|uniref:PLD1_2 n=1 Tax=Lepeophtheirus salmonis TaxID=72036 RepID=A0A7R8HAE3_LEPSM|nr:PLD1_2 [Lepeophtheirus salmonis]CAF2970347.1 PLD1_2 [Lepeophtheirus salmonis]
MEHKRYYVDPLTRVFVACESATAVESQLFSSRFVVHSKREMEDPYATSTFLHGYILLDIFEATDLPDMEGWLAKVVDNKDLTDAFVDVKLGKAKLAKTSVILNSLFPVWNESYRVEVCHFAEELVFEIRDKDHAYSEFIGEVRLSTRELLNGDTREGWFPIMKKNGNPQAI